MAYKLMKRLVEAAVKDGTIEEKRDDYMEKLDVSLAGNRITVAQYQELAALLGGMNDD